MFPFYFFMPSAQSLVDDETVGNAVYWTPMPFLVVSVDAASETTDSIGNAVYWVDLPFLAVTVED